MPRCRVAAGALDRVTTRPALSEDEAVLVGDDPVTDSGALGLGIPVILVPPCRDSTDESLSTVTSWLLSTSRTSAD
jgi:predicted HAD superfamily phosphohydrolase YqeG